MRKMVLISVLTLCVLLLTACTQKDSVFLLKRISWGCSPEEVLSIYGGSISDDRKTVILENFICEKSSETFGTTPGTVKLYFNDEELEKAALTISSENAAEQERTIEAGELRYGLLFVGVQVFYGTEPQYRITEVNGTEIHTADWQTASGEARVQFAHPDDSSGQEAYTILVVCTAPTKEGYR